jgi:hypothetical protein
VIETVQAQKRHKERGKVMKGQTDFKLPDAVSLRKHLDHRDEMTKVELVNLLSRDSDALKGLITLGSSKMRMI